MNKIAIIEDDSAIAQMYKIKLENAGFEVILADNGRTGLSMIQSSNPDLILLDLMMPEMTGDDMLKELRKTVSGKAKKVIILTNVSEDEALPKVKDFNVDDFIVKAEVTPKQLLDKVQKILDS